MTKYNNFCDLLSFTDHYEHYAEKLADFDDVGGAGTSTGGFTAFGSAMVKLGASQLSEEKGFSDPFDKHILSCHIHCSFSSPF